MWSTYTRVPQHDNLPGWQRVSKENKQTKKKRREERREEEEEFTLSNTFLRDISSACFFYNSTQTLHLAADFSFRVFRSNILRLSMQHVSQSR